MSEKSIGEDTVYIFHSNKEYLQKMKGDELQKLSVVQSLPSLMSQDSGVVLSKVLPKIQQELFHSSSDFQVTTSQIFQILISNHLYATEGSITTTLLQSLDSKDPVVASAWLETLLEVIPILPLKTVQSEIIPLAIHKGQCSQPMTSRIASCRILGKTANHPYIKPIEIKKDILPLVHGLCQDINYNVRAAICEQIPYIVQGLGSNLSKNHLLPNLVELSQDDNQNVRAIAVSSVINSLPFLDKETKVGTMSSWVMQLCVVSMKEESQTQLALAKDLGAFLTSMSSCVNPSDSDLLLTYFTQLATKGFDISKYSYRSTDSSQDVLCRQYCAANLPAVFNFIVNNCPNQVEKMYETFKSLASDSCYLVRQTVAGIFHEVARILGKQNILLKPDLVRLLRDEAEEILVKLTPNLGRSFELLTYSGLLAPDKVIPAQVDLSKALLRALQQLERGYNWRLLAEMLKQMEVLPRAFRADQIHADFTPAVVQCAVKGGSRPVRAQASRTLLVFLRWNTRQVQRTWLREHLISELAESSSCYTRHIFIQLCINAIQIFSFKYFKENFFYPLLALAEDPVSTVRYSMVSLLPTLRRMLRLPTDRRLLQSLDQVIMQLERNEKDRDVLTNLIKRSKEMLAAGPALDEETQRKLIEEEDMIAKGKLAFQKFKTETHKTHVALRRESMNPERTRSQFSTKTLSRSVSVSRPNVSASKGNLITATQRSTSVPRTASRINRGVTSTLTSPGNREMISVPRPNIVASKGSLISGTQRSTSISRTPSRISKGVTSTLTSPKNREIISDMSFLNQHFITDTGLSLTDVDARIDAIEPVDEHFESPNNILEETDIDLNDSVSKNQLFDNADSQFKSFKIQDKGFSMPPEELSLKIDHFGSKLKNQQVDLHDVYFEGNSEAEERNYVSKGKEEYFEDLNSEVNDVSDDAHFGGASPKQVSTKTCDSSFRGSNTKIPVYIVIDGPSNVDTLSCPHFESSTLKNKSNADFEAEAFKSQIKEVDEFNVVTSEAAHFENSLLKNQQYNVLGEHFEKLNTQMHSLNVTDDFKVNMRKISRKNSSEIPLSLEKSKRFSSVLFEKDFLPKDSSRRRSLQLPTKESRIPVLRPLEASKNTSNLPLKLKRKQP